MTPQMMSSSGQKRAKTCHVDQCRMPMVLSKKTTPRMIRITGAAIERCRLGATAGLDISHLARRRLNLPLRRNACWPAANLLRPGVNVAFGRSIALKYLHQADHDQDQRPGALEIDGAKVIQKYQHSHRHEKDRP